jgi:hypothetical protein
MTFSKDIKIEALTAAARHCCVCHRYKGVKVEVHHIVPLAKGGADTFENAIVLCFDCHADAGHYNDNHPRGTKYSSIELKRAKEEWFAIVKANKVKHPLVEDYLYARYLVCGSYSAFLEMTSNDLSHIPVCNPHLIRNEVSDFHKYLVASHKGKDRPDSIWGEVFLTKDDYLKKHPLGDVVRHDGDDQYPFFSVHRAPSQKELRDNVAENDFITSMLLKSQVPINEIAQVYAYDEYCGDHHFQEIYNLRPLKPIYLAVSNISELHIGIRSMLCKRDWNVGINYRQFEETNQLQVTEIAFPKMLIPPKATAIIPIATILSPLNRNSKECAWEEYEDISTGELQILAHGKDVYSVSAISVIGPRLSPYSISVESSYGEYKQLIHEFDLSNMYILNRSWECGSCPHVFFETNIGMQYYGEVFGNGPNIEQKNNIKIPTDVKKCCIVELEREITHIKEIVVKNKVILSDILLHQNEEIRFDVSPGDEICLTGYYELTNYDKQYIRFNPWQKNDLIFNYLKSK